MNISVLGLTNPDVNLKRMHQLYNVTFYLHFTTVLLTHTDVLSKLAHIIRSASTFRNKFRRGRSVLNIDNPYLERMVRLIYIQINFS